MHNLKFCNKFMSIFLLTAKQNKLWFDIILTKNILGMLLIFQQLGLVNAFFIFKKNKFLMIKVFIRYVNMELPLLSPFNFFFKPSHKLSITLTNLKKLNRVMGSTSLVISTSKGLKSHHDCLKLNLSGYIHTIIYH